MSLWLNSVSVINASLASTWQLHANGIIKEDTQSGRPTHPFKIQNPHSNSTSNMNLNLPDFMF